MQSTVHLGHLIDEMVPTATTSSFGIRDLDQNLGQTTATEKEGILYRKDNRSWKKSWCVVSEGMMIEYGR